MSVAASPSPSVVTPCRVQVQRLVASRYPGASDGSKPLEWDKRQDGVDLIETLEGAHIRLLSSPMQSPPKPGWILMLTGGTEQQGFIWTLYGIARQH